VIIIRGRLETWFPFYTNDPSNKDIVRVLNHEIKIGYYDNYNEPYIDHIINSEKMLREEFYKRISNIIDTDNKNSLLIIDQLNSIITNKDVDKIIIGYARDVGFDDLKNVLNHAYSTFTSEMDKNNALVDEIPKIGEVLDKFVY